MQTLEEKKDAARKKVQRYRDQAVAKGLCMTCKTNPIKSGRQCNECAESFRARAKAQRANRLAAGLCKDCGELPFREGLTSCAECAKVASEKNRKRRAERRAADPTLCVSCTLYPRMAGSCRCTACERMRQKARQDVLDGYGNKCACCGETEPLFLTIDHVNGRTTAEGKDKKLGYALYRHIVKLGFPNDFRILCWNCNCSRGIWGRCPHEQQQVLKCEAA